MPSIVPVTWSIHKKRWSNCTKCNLHTGRSNVVLARGKIPADVVFVGEAPGFSEDTLGLPFVGNAGTLLDELIEEAEEASTPVKKLFTNIVSCIPKDESGYKVSQPEEDWLNSCKPRLQEIVKLSKAKAIVMVGKMSSTWSPKLIDQDFGFSADIIHPAAILRLDISQRPLAEQRTIVTLRDLFEEVHANS